MKNTISKLLQDSASLKQKVAADASLVAVIEKAFLQIKKTVHCGGTVYACGNGGSACDAMHFTEELVARYKRERQGFRAMHFLDPGTLTCWSNDYSYEAAFERQARVFCTKNDILLGISTSGKSKNILAAFKAAREAGAYTIGLTGKDGGLFPSACDTAIIVPSQETERIQEVHITLIHIICELLETT